MTLAPDLRRAFALHQAGDLAGADAMYRKILRKDPGNYSVLHLLGVLCHQRGNNSEAAQFLGRALEERPDASETLNYYGLALHNCGKFSEALNVLDRALQIRPGDSVAWNDRGVVLTTLRQLDEAVASFDRAIALRPEDWEAYYNRATALLAQKKSQEALASCDAALALKPDFAPAHNNRGSALVDLRRFAQARTSYEAAIALMPRYAQAHGNLANVLTTLGAFREALESCDAAIAIDGTVTEFFDAKGTAHLNLEQPEKALASYDRATSLKPDFAEAHSHRGAALLVLGRPLEALASYDLALGLHPVLAEAHNNRGSVLVELRRFDEALSSFEKAIALQPNYAEAYANKGSLLLLLERYREGWESYRIYLEIWRSETGRAISRPGTGTEKLSGKTIYIASEELGFGDAIQFCRYVKFLETQGAKVILSLRPALMRLLQHLTPTVALRTTPPQDFDLYFSLLSLPLIFSPDKYGFFNETPYIKAEPALVKKWAGVIGQQGFKVGVCWRGSSTDISRSFPAHRLAGIAAIPGLRLISLQKGKGREDLAAMPGGVKIESLGENFDAGPDAFIDTAAVMENLDLIITLDTAVAHLAGALGRPTWVALKFVPDWRWFLGRADSPWYPGMRLFRQSTYGDWDSVFAAMEKELKKLSLSQ